MGSELPKALDPRAAENPDFSDAPPSTRVGAGEGPDPEPGSDAAIVSAAGIRILADIASHLDPANKAAHEASAGTPGTLQYVDSKAI